VEMDEVVQLAKEDVLRNNHATPIIAFYGRKLDGSKAKGLFFLEVDASSQVEKAQILHMAGARLRRDNVLSRLEKVFLAAPDLVKSEPEWIVGLHICGLDLATNKMTSRTFEYLKDKDGNIKDVKLVKVDFENNIPTPIISAFVAGFNGG